MGANLNLVSPLATLNRGYSISRDTAGNIIRKAEHKLLNSAIKLQLAEGNLECQVTSIGSDQTIKT